MTLTAAETAAPGLPTEQGRPVAAPARLDSVDLLRGAVMVLMALDHLREYLGPRGDPEDLATATPALFLTRWVTHFCAPAFVFLAGAGAYLRGARLSRRTDLARFLLTRGLLLVVLEFTLVHWVGTFSFDYRSVVAQVIWAIGASMVLLSGLVFLPARAVGLVGVAILAGHNLFDGVRGADLGPAGWLWDVLHTRRPFKPLPGHGVFLAYPLLPWFGVMAAGYGFGPLLGGEPARRRARLLALGTGLTLAFVLLRAVNGYGDNRPWSAEGGGLLTALSFLNCQKYPPSLLFVLMTLGPCVIALALADWLPGAVARPLTVFGRVPLFYYVLHIALIEAVAVGLALATYGRADFLIGSVPGPPPEGYGYGLPVLYLLWAGCVAALYPACLWFAGVKRRHPREWLSYF
jgi:uncharacterized membrane protein